MPFALSETDPKLIESVEGEMSLIRVFVRAAGDERSSYRRCAVMERHTHDLIGGSPGKVLGSLRDESNQSRIAEDIKNHGNIVEFVLWVTDNLLRTFASDRVLAFDVCYALIFFLPCGASSENEALSLSRCLA
jgi:hypothetical protein